MNTRFAHRLVLWAVAILALFLATGCIGPGGSSPVVAYTTASGEGDVRSDANWFVVLGGIEGSTGVFAKGSGFPLTFPIDVSEGQWVAYNRKTDETFKGEIGVDPLPDEVLELYRPGELDMLFVWLKPLE